MNRMTRSPSETTADTDAVRQLRRIVLEGEGLHLEFKRKASSPDKIVRELIAFANTDGGTLLIGVDDDGNIPGIKYPDEEIHVVKEALAKHCKPALTYNESVISLSETRFIVRLDVPPRTGGLHYFLSPGVAKQTFVRSNDMSIKASAEMEEILRRTAQDKGIKFTFGDAEKKLMEYLEEYKIINLVGYQKFSGLNQFKARRKLILLVLASVLKITVTEKGDWYSRR